MGLLNELKKKQDQIDREFEHFKEILTHFPAEEYGIEIPNIKEKNKTEIRGFGVLLVLHGQLLQSENELHRTLTITMREEPSSDIIELERFVVDRNSHIVIPEAEGYEGNINIRLAEYKDKSDLGLYSEIILTYFMKLAFSKLDELRKAPKQNP
ncbi:hypothetical protein IDSA_04120 [Pseudidiomarina salinarum]|uniref:Uncharacterized protein n=1 Tax=Pseudidiomarina salinarum TaxID=435908 RepID=A0A094IXS0_9GAMM|nr:hypothetical protein [Pseudidiomarina salinarum]KFZ31877.1 hypothetical protein IDSA_04120 [Pseudidiomarina salinarum]RUO70349.1 hypothetical protein CWI79_02465 [Pseudidiomarina salinarum]